MGQTEVCQNPVRPKNTEQTDQPKKTLFACRADIYKLLHTSPSVTSIWDYPPPCILWLDQQTNILII